jgi:outer membrane protein
MNAQEQLTQAQNQYAQTQEQYQQVKDMIEAGTSAEKNLVDVEAQLTNEDLAISQVNNQLMLAYLNLKQIMQLDLSKDIKIKTPKLPDDIMIAAPAALGNIYQAALGIRPEIKSAELKIESSKKAVDIAKTAYYPSLKFVSNINTFMSTQNKNTQQYLTGNTTAVGFVEGTFQRVLIPESGYKQSKIPYFKQLNQNLNYALGLSLDIPIFSQYRVQTSIKQAQLQTLVANFQKQIEEQTLYNTIAQAYLKTLASIDNYHAAKKNFETAQKSYDFAMERWDAGMINLLETNIAKTNLLNAESKFIQTKYEYLFNSKVLDFYQGKKIEL